MPKTVLRLWNTISVDVARGNTSNYWIDIKDIFYRALE